MERGCHNLNNNSPKQKHLATQASRDSGSQKSYEGRLPVPTCSGVMPCAFFALASAFAARRRRTTSMCPRLACARAMQRARVKPPSPTPPPP
eukprot:2383875-Pleurochrysis_carterae.AAC.1